MLRFANIPKVITTFATENSSMMKKLLILNGPNLNLLGHREQAIYGSTTFEEYLTELQKHFAQYVTIDYAQSNVEGELINILHSAVGQYLGVI
ncbi:MAG: type II 3-dehydroquinate dehydratase, partial [Mucinivorans sp.]